MSAPRIGIVGGGKMGTEIAQAAALHGYNVWIAVKDSAAFEACFARINQNLTDSLEAGEINEKLRIHIKKHIRVEVSLSQLAECDYIIEALPEDLELKKSVFAELDALCPEHTIFCTNSESISVDELCTNRSDRFIGFRFYSPVSTNKRVDITRCKETSEATVENINALAKRLHKQAFRLTDSKPSV